MWYKYIDLTSCPLTWHYHPWFLYFFAYSWLSLLRGLDYYIITRHLVLLNSCIPEPLEKGDSCYYTHVNPRNRITMTIRLLWIPDGYYHWTILITRQLTPRWGKLMSTDIRYQVISIAWQVPVLEIKCRGSSIKYNISSVGINTVCRCHKSYIKYNMANTDVRYHGSNIAWQVAVSGIICQI